MITDEETTENVVHDKIIELFEEASLPDLVLNDLQTEAILRAAEAIEKHQDYTIHGCAGTGKTVVLAYLARMYPHAYVVAPTGKAALNIGAKMERTASTIHSLFYSPIPNTHPVKFEPNQKINYRSTILLDEASMVTEKTRQDIKKALATIIACGDPAQLKPVAPQDVSPVEKQKYLGGFSNPNITLSEIHRQAQNSPIIRQATRVRKGFAYNSDTENFRVISQYDLKTQDLLDADIVLCWKNETVDRYNNRIRNALGYSADYAETGEPVLCLHNCNEYGIMNGGIYQAASNYDPTKGTIDLAGKGTFEGIEWNRRPRKQIKNLAGEFFWKSGVKLGYAITVHKSQGSEWNNVVLIDEMPRSNAERKNWLYTAITRAVNKITIVRCV